MTTTKKTPTPWATVATAVRRDLKAQRDDLGIPATATIKVTSDSFAGGASVDVQISGADDWAWTVAGPDHRLVLQGYREAGEKVLNDTVNPLGDKIADLILTARNAVDAGYIWGGVTYQGTTIGTLAKAGWSPGQD